MADDSLPAQSLAERARSDVARLVVGNGLAATDVTLLDQNEATYQIAARLDLAITVTTQSVSGKGRPKMRLRHMFEHAAQLDAALPIMRQELIDQQHTHTVIIQKIAQRDDKGWGMVDETITFPELDETFGAVEGCAPCNGKGATLCTVCNGQAQQECNTCFGRRDIQCNLCSGTGKDANGQTCTKCGGLRRMSCPTCQGKGQIFCRACNGRGQQPCKNCDATGSVYQLATLSIAARSHFQIQPDETMSAELQRALTRLPPKALLGGRAKIASGDSQVDKNIIHIHYSATLPFARPRIGIGAADISLSIIGYKPIIAESPFFMDGLLQPAINIIRGVRANQIDGTRALADLSQLRIVREALTDFSTVKTLRKRYPFGLSPQLADELIKSLRYIAARITTRPRQLAAMAAICLSIVIFLIYFVFSTRSSTRGFSPFDIILLATMLGFNICAVLVAHMFALEYAMKRFSKKFKAKTNNIGAALGTTGLWTIIITIISFVAVYLLAHQTGAK